jgi:hypothetical protein
MLLMNFNMVKIQQSLMLLWVIKIWMSLKRGELESKIVFLVNGYPTNAQLQYNGTWSTGLSVAKINHYGNQNSE